MNISQLVRSLIGEPAARADAKAIVLSPGQVVFGTVIKLLGDDTALLNMQGHMLRAEMRTPLAAGERSAFQVQPESTSGQIVLKPLAASTVPVDERSMPELIRGFGLKDDSAVRHVIRIMQQEGVPLTKENVSAFQRLHADVPRGEAAETWLRAGAVAYHRNLPLTDSVVRPLHALLFAPPLAETLADAVHAVKAALRGASVALLGPSAALSGSSVSHNAPAAPSLLLNIVNALEQAIRPPFAVERTEPHNLVSTQVVRAFPPRVHAAAPEQSTTNLGERIVSNQGQIHREQITSNQGQVHREQVASNQVHTHRDQTAPNPAPIQRELGSMNGESLSGWLKSLGIDHENLLVRPRLPMGLESLEREQAPLFYAALDNEATENAAKASGREAAETLKSLLIQAVQRNDVPASVKEPLQLLLQQITGQQLMLSAERNAFAHITLFIPFFGENGERGSAVHIQSRKDGRGKFDADNCTMLFDLRMQTIGETLIEVSVANRVVSVHVHNDMPLAAELIDEGRSDLKSALEQTGYQMITMRTSPFPSSDVKHAKTPMYRTNTHKGVDIRI